MAVFYRPPDPNVGGLGPLLPREQTPPSVDSPPFNSRGIALLMAVAMVCWAPPPPQPQPRQLKLPVSVIAIPEDTPNPTRNVMAGLYSWWKTYDVPQRLPVVAAIIPVASVDNPPFTSRSQTPAIIAAWNPINVPIQKIPKAPLASVITPADNPPFGTRSILSNLITTWIAGPPLPQLQKKFISEVVVQGDNPPFKRTSEVERMAAIIAPWYPPPPLPQLNRKVVSIPVFVSFPWELNAILTCRGDGVTGSIIGQSFFVYMKTGSGYLALPMMNVSPVPIDFTQLLTMDLTAKWGSPVTFENIILTNIVMDLG